ncbi:MAG: RNA-binding protein [Chloroflexi bacterium]|nr:MAG: RNA-binding protein [Chloroflexota bacterium]
MEPAAETIKLDQFLKLAQVVQSGGEAKHLIQSGAVQVNGQIETRRGRKLRHGDVVVVEGEELVVQVTPDQDTPEDGPAD